MDRFIAGVVLLGVDIYDIYATTIGWFNWSITNQLPQTSIDDVIPQFVVWIWTTAALGSAALIGYGYRAWKQGNSNNEQQ